MVTDLVMTLMQRDLCDLGSQILIRNLVKERTLKFPIKTNLGLLLNRWLKINRDDSRAVKNSDQQKEGKLSLALPFHWIKHIKLFPQRDEHLFFSVLGVRDH